MLHKLTLQTLAAIGLTIGTSTVLKNCSIEDEPMYNKKAAWLPYGPYGEDGVPAFYVQSCPETGTNCRALFPSGFEFQREALEKRNEFITAARTGTLQTFYNSTDWNAIFPNMDAFHADILVKLQNGTYTAKAGIDSSIFIIDSRDGIMTQDNIVASIKLAKQR